MPEFAGFDFSKLPADWSSKRGFWAADADSIRKRAQWVRQWLKERPEKDIVLIAHGDILRNITAGAKGPSEYAWKNAEVRIYHFDEKYVDQAECFLDEEGVVAAAGGYGPTSTEIDIVGA